MRIYTVMRVVIFLIPCIIICKTPYIYCDESSNILNSLYNYLQNTLYSHLIIILIILFCILKFTELCDEFPTILYHKI